MGKNLRTFCLHHSGLHDDKDGIQGSVHTRKTFWLGKPWVGPRSCCSTNPWRFWGHTTQVPEESHKGDLLSFETSGSVAVRVHPLVLADILNSFARWASVGGRHTARHNRPPCPSTRTLWSTSLQPTSVCPEQVNTQLHLGEERLAFCLVSGLFLFCYFKLFGFVMTSKPSVFLR